MSRSHWGVPQKLGRLGTALGLAILVGTMNGCEGWIWNEQDIASQVRARGEIRVLTIQHPLVLKTRKGQAPMGLDHDLLENFAATYGLKIKFVLKKDLDEVYEGLRQGEGDIAAARLWIPQRSEGFISGPALEESHLSLYCRKNLKIQHVSDLKTRRVGVTAKDNGESLDVRLRQFVNDVDVVVDSKSTTRALMQQVAEGALDCLIAENLDGAIASATFAAVEKVTPLTEDRPLGWALRPEREDLRSLMQAWFQRASRDDEIMRIQDRYRSSLGELERSDIARFLRNLRSRMPRYAKAFRESADEHGLDWKLVASVAYQESHWDADATSHTGVRGLMQLTEDTASHVGIDDRTDPLQSIWGGASYLRSLLDRMPSFLDAQERLALALAAYNAGLAHLRDAQALALERGLNPYSWRHLKTIFPLLEDADVAARLPAGPCRGRETVQFVERVRAFHNVFLALQ